MAKIPEVLWEPINTAFPHNVILIATAMPDGYAQISPRGSVLVYDEETLAFWDRGHGRTHDNTKEGDKVTLFLRDSELRSTGVLPLGGIARFYGTVSLHHEGAVRETVWERMVEPERNRDPEKKGFAVLVSLERVEDLEHKPLET